MAADKYKQVASSVSKDAPNTRTIGECAADNPANPTDAEIEQYKHLLEAGYRYVVTRRKIAETTLLGDDGKLGTLELQEFGNAKLKGSWDDIKYKPIPWVGYNHRPSSPPPGVPRTGPKDTSATHPGWATQAANKYPFLSSLSVHGGAPFGPVPGQKGSGRLYFYKVGVNKLKPAASVDGVTNVADGYPNFKPLQGGEGVTLVGFNDKKAILNIAGTDINSYWPVVINSHSKTTHITASEQSSSTTELHMEPSSSDTLIDLNIGDMVVDVKKLDKKSNFQICSPVGVGGIRG